MNDSLLLSRKKKSYGNFIEVNTKSNKKGLDRMKTTGRKATKRLIFE